MNAHEERVRAKHSELNEELLQLLAFVNCVHSTTFYALPKFEQELLQQQATIMQQYADILEKRIEGFKRGS